MALLLGVAVHQRQLLVALPGVLQVPGAWHGGTAVALDFGGGAAGACGFAGGAAVVWDLGGGTVGA